MKKETIITIRVNAEIKSIIQSIAEKDDRTLAWMVRKLLMEALDARELLEPKTGKQDKP
ncbi:MAG: hypothetical protein ACE5IH_04345 [Thermodesulfobacteriota bacterium]